MKSPKIVRSLQYAALPFRRTGSARLQIMLATSRNTRRWIIPKGWPKIGLPPYKTAEEEAFEEAGLSGIVGKRHIGAYSYEKILKDGDTIQCRVKVYPLEVTRQHKTWPERRQRRTEWFGADEAAQSVQERALQRLIRKFAKRR